MGQVLLRKRLKEMERTLQPAQLIKLWSLSRLKSNMLTSHSPTLSTVCAFTLLKLTKSLKPTTTKFEHFKMLANKESSLIA